jgi:putative NADPH-quinone reductase
MKQSRVLIINGSYREGGFTDQAVAAASGALHEAGADTRAVDLRDYPIEFCTNCRECALEPGSAPGRCVLDDGMQKLIDEIEASDALVLAAPTNFGSVTAIFKRFMERLMPYAYWPPERPWPVYRKAGEPRSKALLISSSAAPAWLGRWVFGSVRQLEMTAKLLGAKPVGRLFTGHAANPGDRTLPAGSVDDARRLARRLLDN